MVDHVAQVLGRVASLNPRSLVEELQVLVEGEDAALLDEGVLHSLANLPEVMAGVHALDFRTPLVPRQKGASGCVFSVPAGALRVRGRGPRDRLRPLAVGLPLGGAGRSHRPRPAAARPPVDETVRVRTAAAVGETVRGELLLLWARRRRGELLLLPRARRCCLS